MKIIYLHQYFNTPEMPGGTRSYELARRLVQWGHDVHMITSKRTDANAAKGWEHSIEAGINVHWYPVRYSNKMSFNDRIRAFLKFVFVSAKKASSLNGDVVFATSTPLTIALPGVFASKRLKVPFVFEVRDLWPEVPIKIGALDNKLIIEAARILEKFAYNQSEQIIALSPGMKEGIVKAGYPEQKVNIIPNSSDIDLFDVPDAAGQRFRDEHDWLGDRPLVVYTGTLGIVNGVSFLARLADRARLINPDVRFLVVGDGREYRKVKEKALELGVLNRNFFMFGETPKREIPSILSAADVATSLVIDMEVMWANSANKFFDALASGTPIMINYKGWQSDLLEKYGAGIVVPPGRPDEAAVQLVDFITHKKRLKKAAGQAKALAREQFDRDKLARDFLHTLEKVAG